MWRDGKNYLKTDLENDWNYLIGSNRTGLLSHSAGRYFKCNGDELP